MKEYVKVLSQAERDKKIKKAAKAYEKFMNEILPGWESDPNSSETPTRVSKMFVNELYAGLYGEKPKITAFDNVDKYDGMVFEGNIEVKSQCSHHHMPFFGKAFIAYIPSSKGKVIGLSKLNRIVEYFCRRPQVQENLTMQIHDYLCDVLEESRGVAILIKANHTCVSHRGANQNSEMQTAKLSGLFFTNEIGSRQEFYEMISNLKK